MVELSRAVGRLVAPLKRRVLLMVGRGVVSLVNDALTLQGLQVGLFAEEVRDGVERFQEYGFSSHPHVGAEAVVVFAGGDRSHGLAIAVDDRRYRLKTLAAGEVALYTDEGDTIVLRRDRRIEVTAGAKVVVTAPEVEATATTRVVVTAPEVEVVAETQVTLTTPLCAVSGNLEVGGVLTAEGAIASGAEMSDPTGSMDEMRGVYNGHKHSGGGNPPIEQMT